MNIEEILDSLDEMLDKSWSMPLSGGKCVIDPDRMRDLIDDMRVHLPAELQQAKDLLSERNEMIASAKKESEIIIRKAEERAHTLLSQEEIVKEAQRRASEVLTQAQTQSKEMKQAAFQFSDDCLRQTEEVLSSSLKNVHSTRQALRGNAKNK